MTTHANNGATFRIGANPIIWSNDDFHDLGGDIPLQQCLAEMAQAGYAGTELGHKYPRDPGALLPLLEPHGLSVVSGWHSLELLSASFDTEAARYRDHLQFLKRCGSDVVIVAECTRRVYHDPASALQFESRAELLSAADWDRLAVGVEALAEMTREYDMRLVYHHHMGTVIQNEAEIDQLMARTHVMKLLLDTGHLAFAGVDPLRILQRYRDRVGHVHLKDVRASVVHDVRLSCASFATAVRNGVFTVPGDGSIDYAPIFATLRDMHYDGWLVVEAEQDPRKAPPLQYARSGRAYIRQMLGV